MRLRTVMVPLAVAVLALGACGGDDDDDDEGGGDGGSEESEQLENKGTVNLLSAVEPEEGEAVQAIFDELINSDADYKAEIEASADFEEQFQIRAEGGDLDLAAVPQPGAIQALVDDGSIVSLEDIGFDVSGLNDLMGESFVELGVIDGEHYGLPTNINLKSMIWYPKDDFDAAGYTVPETWDELIALSDQIVADGSTPWCVGFESGGASGWPATDWMEDIMLRTAGPDTYDQWWSHEIPFNDDTVAAAGERFGEVMFGEGYVLGGAEATPDIAFGDAPGPMFESPPGCWLHRQATFINAFFPETAVAGVDYDWFPFPTIDEEGVLYGGEFTVVGTAANRPEVVDFLNAYISQEVQCQLGGVEASSRVSPNIDVGPDCYANDILADASAILTAALDDGSGRFDASDLMPAEVGSGSFWTGMLDYMGDGPDALPGILDEIEGTWPE